MINQYRRAAFAALLIIAFAAGVVNAQEPATATAAVQTPAASSAEQPKQVLNLFIDRVGFGKTVNYSYFEWFQIRGTKHPKWSVIMPDVGMIAFDDIAAYRELFIGAGFEVQPFSSLTIDHEAYIEQATGPDSHAKTWYLPWTRIEFDVPHTKLVLQTVFFPYVPLNGGDSQFVLEHAKVQYNGWKHLSLCAGYGAYQDFTATGSRWDSKPFVGGTVKTSKLGDFEIWAQALPNSGFQFQIRHSLAWKTKR